MRRTLLLATLAVAAAAPVLPAAPASACDPNRPVVGCHTACSYAQYQYSNARRLAGYRGPSWYDLNLGVCGT